MNMPVVIWTRLSLDVLKEELIKADLPLSRFKFLSRPQDISRAEIILGQFPVRSEATAGSLRWVQLDIDEAAEDVDHMISPEELLRVAMARQ